MLNNLWGWIIMVLMAIGIRNVELIAKCSSDPVLEKEIIHSLTWEGCRVGYFFSDKNKQ